jgi:hypothetical protein
MRRSYDEAMDVWRARDAYRVQTAWMALWGMVFGLPFVFMLTSGHWGKALGIVSLWWLVEWALPRGLRWLLWQMQDGARWAGRWSLDKAWRWWVGAWRWWHAPLLAVVLGGLLTGCQGFDCWVASLHGLHGDPVTGVCMPTQEPAPVHLPAAREEATR